jgi:ketosteroid isomerase-like protein
MGAQQNAETVKAMYEAFGRGDVDAILDRLTDDVDWSTDAAITSAPWYGPRLGKDSVRDFFQGIGQTGPVTEFTPVSFASSDEGDVMVFLRYAFTVAATGKTVSMNLHHYWRFRDGKVCYVRASEDTAQVAAALTP